MKKNDIYKSVMLELNNLSPPDLLDSSSNEVYVFNNKFEKIYDLTLSMYHWYFLNMEIMFILSEEEVSDKKEFKYMIDLPEDFLRLVSFSDQSTIYNGRIYTNSLQFSMNYLHKPTLEKIPNWFTEYLIIRLAREIAPILTGDINLEQRLRIKEEELKKIALASDVCNQPQQELNTNTFLIGRE